MIITGEEILLHGLGAGPVECVSRGQMKTAALGAVPVVGGRILLAVRADVVTETAVGIGMPVFALAAMMQSNIKVHHQRHRLYHPWPDIDTVHGPRLLLSRQQLLLPVEIGAGVHGKKSGVEVLCRLHPYKPAVLRKVVLCPLLFKDATKRNLFDGIGAQFFLCGGNDRKPRFLHIFWHFLASASTVFVFFYIQNVRNRRP